MAASARRGWMDDFKDDDMPLLRLGQVHPLEYRWRLAILFLSQPALAGLCHVLGGCEGTWYAPRFTRAAGLLAVGLAAAGVALRIWATSFMTAAVMSSKTPNTDHLVCGGPYANSRNPLYVGTLLIFAGYGLFFGWWAALGYILFHIVRYERIIRYEESQLRRRWGQVFDDYCRQVPRWLPALGRRPSLAGPYLSAEAVWGNAIFIGIALGYAASVGAGTLAALIPVELAGTGVTAGYFLFAHSPPNEGSAAVVSPASAAGPQLAAAKSGAQRRAA